ncbi:MAG TPA: TSUP family transporter [Ktedonobacteraceae bacterium]
MDDDHMQATNTAQDGAEEKVQTQHRAASAIEDKVMTTIIGGVLLGGVLLSSVIIFVGLLLLLASPGALTSDRTDIFPHTFGELWTGLLGLHPQAIIVAGLLLLIATPVLRVAISILAFALERDRRYVLITSLVFAILLFSFIFVSGAPVTSQPETAPTPSLIGIVFIFAGSILAGLLGALVGLGGGVLIVPLLTLAFKLPIAYAIGASIISVIATSSGAAAAYVRDHMTNMRIGMFLEIATTTGAICGAFIAGLINPAALYVVFGLVLLISAAPLVFKLREELPQGVKNDRWANVLSLNGSYPDTRSGEVSYQATRTPYGFGMMYIAGLISGLLGIGSGTFKVLAMDTFMRLPMKVSTTTSNFMIGVTAAASAGIYFSRGNIRPVIAAPVALGILIGALVGARVLAHLHNRTVRMIFLPILVIIALEMVLRGFGIAL